jgi:beta-alanine--pyruvate transaminase
VSDEIYQAFMAIDDPGIELSHGFTYSGHPLACAAGMATLDIYEQEGLLDRAQGLERHWNENALRLQGQPHVIDVRCHALIGAIEFAPRPGAPMQRGLEVAQRCYALGLWARNIGDMIVLSPPLIISEAEITQMFDTVVEAVKATA